MSARGLLQPGKFSVPVSGDMMDLEILFKYKIRKIINFSKQINNYICI